MKQLAGEAMPQMSQVTGSTSIGTVTAFFVAAAYLCGAQSNASPATVEINALCDMTKTRSWIRGEDQDVRQLAPDNQVMKSAYLIDTIKNTISSVNATTLDIPPLKAKDALITKDRAIAYFQGEFISEVVEIDLVNGKVKAEAIGRGPIRLEWVGNCSLRQQ